MTVCFTCDKAAFRIVPRDATVFIGDLADTVAGDSSSCPPLTGMVKCPRGCGTAIYWALSSDLIEYKEQFLIYLYQQLCWTPCPQHDQIQAQATDAPAVGPAGRRASSNIVSRGPRYANGME